MVLEQRGGLFVQQDDGVLVQLQNARGAPGAEGAVDHVAHGLGLVCAKGAQHDLAGLHDAADAKGKGLSGHILLFFKDTAVGFDGALGQVDHLGAVAELVRRLVEADVAVLPQAQQLQVDAARPLDGPVLIARLFFHILGDAGGHARILHVDVVKQLLVHKVAVAAGMIGLEAHILIQVEAAGI